MIIRIATGERRKVKEVMTLLKTLNSLFCIAALLCGGVIAYGESYAPPEWSTFGRLAPLIVTAKAQESCRYEVVSEYEYSSYRTFKVISVEKDILTDYDIPENGLIEVQRSHDVYFGDLAKVVAYVEELRHKKTPISNKAVLLFLTLNNAGEWTTPPPSMTIRVEKYYEEVRDVGSLEPVGIDGLATTYTLDEWQEIVDANISWQYYRLNFPREDHRDWPNTFEDAVALVVSEFEESGRVPTYGYHLPENEIYNALGLAIVENQARQVWEINKQLLLSMGRLPPKEARSKILITAQARIDEKYDLDFRESMKTTIVDEINFAKLPVSKAVENLLVKLNFDKPYRLVVSPDSSALKVNINLRNLSVDRCLQFVLQQPNCDLSLEIPIGEELVFHLTTDV